MNAPDPGHFWKVPFFWQPGCPLPPAQGRLSFAAAEPAALEAAMAEVMASSIDESDQAAVAELGSAGAARELLAIDTDYFRVEPDWWRLAHDAQGRLVGFVLPVLFQHDRQWRDGQPQGTIYYMGVLPAQRGRGHGRELLDEATRLFVARGCWRIFCDTSAANAPMLAAFRGAGYTEREPWQRPLR